MISRASGCMVSNPITCCSVMRWSSTPRGMECPQHKKTEGAFRPLERGVDHLTSAVESSSPLDVLSLHVMWTPCGRLISYKIMSIISVGCDFTTKSGGIWFLQFHMYWV